MDAPGLELLRREDPLNRRCRDRVDDTVPNQRSRQIAAGPCRERPCLVIRQLAGELDQVRRHDRGKNAGAARFEVHLQDHVARVQRSAPPTFGRSSVGDRRAGSPPLATPRQRAAGSCVLGSHPEMGTSSRVRSLRARFAARDRGQPSTAPSWASVASRT